MRKRTLSRLAGASPSSGISRSAFSHSPASTPARKSPTASESSGTPASSSSAAAAAA